MSSVPPEAPLLEASPRTRQLGLTSLVALMVLAGIPTSSVRANLKDPGTSSSTELETSVEELPGFEAATQGRVTGAVDP